MFSLDYFPRQKCISSEIGCSFFFCFFIFRKLKHFTHFRLFFFHSVKSQNEKAKKTVDFFPLVACNCTNWMDIGSWIVLYVLQSIRYVLPEWRKQTENCRTNRRKNTPKFQADNARIYPLRRSVFWSNRKRMKVNQQQNLFFFSANKQDCVFWSQTISSQILLIFSFVDYFLPSFSNNSLVVCLVSG